MISFTSASLDCFSVLFNKSNIQGIEKCAELKAQGMDCQPSVEPVASDGDGEDDGDDGDDGDEAPGEIWETCEEIPLTRSSCTGEVCSPEYFGFDLSSCTYHFKLFFS